MNDIVKSCIESRKTALFSAYNIQDPGTISQINDYFAKLEEFGKDFNDAMEFETKFASSPLAQEYTDLFVLVMNTEKDVNGNAPTPQEPEKEYTVADEVADDMTRLARRKARQEAYDVARDVPGLGQAMTAKQHMDFFGGIFRRKKDD